MTICKQDSEQLIFDWKGFYFMPYAQTAFGKRLK